MLLSIGVENYRSIGDMQYLILNATSQSEHENGLLTFNFDENERRVNPIAAIFGGNAVGKSNFLKAIRFMKDSILKSKQEGEKIEYSPCRFQIDKKHSRYLVNFLVNNIRYSYELSHSNTRIEKEALFMYKTTHPTRIFERTKENYKFNSQFKSLESISENSSKENNLFLNTLSSLSNNQTIKEVLTFFREKLIMENIETIQSKEKTVEQIKEQFIEFYDKEKLKLFDKYFKNILKNMVDGLKGFVISNVDINNDFILSIFTDEELKTFDIEKLQELLIEKIKSVKDPTLLASFASSMKEELYLVYEGKNNKKVYIPLKDESRGVIKIFDVGVLICKVLHEGGILIYDEFETCFHPFLVRKLVSTFLNKNKNKNNAQLIFTTHNTNILDLNLIRRDQAWFVGRNKKTDYMTKLINLSTIKNVRKKENIEKGYLEERYVKAFDYQIKGIDDDE